ncbi:hypothetical protein ACVQ90_03150 [Staphylococcus aureus]
MINGTQAMTAQGVISYIEAEDLGYQSKYGLLHDVFSLLMAL